MDALNAGFAGQLLEQYLIEERATILDQNIRLAVIGRRDGIPDARITIEDLRGDGDHYAAHVVSSAFRGKSRVQQHQLVYQALRGRMGNELHALALQTSTPAD